jgi:peroxiredoxin
MTVRGMRALTYLVVASLAAIAGFALHHLWNSSRAVPGPGLPPSVVATHAALLGQSRPEFSLTSLSGEPISIRRWDGQVILLNFWATWCPPCRREIPAFVDLFGKYRERGFQIVGVAIDDPDKVRSFVHDFGVDYPQLVGEQDAARVSERYGNRYGALPYSVLIDRTGIIRFIRPGELPSELLETELKKLL